MNNDDKTIRLPPGSADVLRDMDLELNALDISLQVGRLNRSTHAAKVAFVEANTQRKLLKLQEAG